MLAPYLSKSDYMKFLTHPAYLWLQKNDKTKLPAITYNDQFIFDQGFAFEAEAQGMFVHGVGVEAKAWEFDELVKQTKDFINSGNEVIFQATFMSKRRLMCKVDVLQKNEDGWNIYEIKASTKVKDDHKKDLAFQVLALRECGLIVKNASVIHVNSDFVRSGEIKPESIAQIVNVTEEVELLITETSRLIDEAFIVIASEKMPDPSPAKAGNFYQWMEVYRHLYKEVNSNSIYNLAQIKSWQIRELNKKGIVSLDDVPGAIKLNDRQQEQLRARVNGPHIAIDKISTFLSDLSYPLYFLDYETAAYVLPLYDRTRPYQQVPFQYSLHIINEPGGEVLNKEYLHQSSSYPVRELLEHLIEDIGTTGSILVWYAAFEKGCNKDMGVMEPQFHKRMELLNKRVVDLMDPFGKNWYVDAAFEGSASIKKVMPVIAPDLTYKDLGIQEGGSAQREYVEIVLGKKTKAEAEKIYSDLIEYCGLDTYAMVRIYEELVKICSNYTNKSDSVNASDLPVQASLF